MAQILTLNYEFEPKNIFWSVANCKTFDKIWEFLRPDSTIILKPSDWTDEDFVLKLKLMKLQFNNLTIIQVDKGIEKEDKVYYWKIPEDELENFIEKNRIRKIKFVDKKKFFQEIYKLIK